MDIVTFLDTYGTAAIGIMVVGTSYRMIRHLYLIISKRRPKGRTLNTPDNPEFYSFGQSVRNTFFNFPAKRFGMNSNKLYTYGLILYHVDIISITIGYIASGVIVLRDVIAGNQIPDISAGLAQSANYTVGNILTIIFGNAGILQSTYLFGNYGQIFINVTWVAIFFAVLGNTAVLLARITQNGGGSIVSDVDPAAKGVRVGGIRNKNHIFVTLMLTAIIWSEILSRTGVSGAPSLEYFHAILGATLLMIAPFTYLFHMFYVPVYLFYGARRWQKRYIG
jgi:nitrate reductase gamma subunit